MLKLLFKNKDVFSISCVHKAGHKPDKIQLMLSNYASKIPEKIMLRFLKTPQIPPNAKCT